MVAEVQVLASDRLRPIGAGLVRAATGPEVARATNLAKMAWPVPVGSVVLADGSAAPVCVDGVEVFGFESGHMLVSGSTGSAKTSFMTVVVKNMLARANPEGGMAGALLINVKGDDLLALDRPPRPGYELTDDDLQLWRSMGHEDPGPFSNVEVWAPAMPGGMGARSKRSDAIPMQWDLREMWTAMRWLYPWMMDDDKISGFLAYFADEFLWPKRPGAQAIRSFGAFDALCEQHLRAADEDRRDYCFDGRVHVATLRRIRRIFSNVPAKFKGLVGDGEAPRDADIPVSGWWHGRVVVLDLTQLDHDVQGVVIARTVERILKASEEGTLFSDPEGRPGRICIVTDELNRYAPKVAPEMPQVRKILQRVMTQGRYAGVSVIAACQKPGDIDELVVSNCSTKVSGRSSEMDLGVYDRLPSGLVERIVTMPRGSMAVWHPWFRTPVVVRFPRPSYATGRFTAGERAEAAPIDMLARLRRHAGVELTSGSVARLTEGLDHETVERIAASATDADDLVARLEKARQPDPVKSTLVGQRPAYDPDNIFNV